jgi:hypothetical protein
MIWSWRSWGYINQHVIKAKENQVVLKETNQWGTLVQLHGRESETNGDRARKTGSR